MQFSVFRPTRIINGKAVKSRLWSTRIKLTCDSKARYIALGLSDEKAARAKAEGLLREMEQEQEGLLAPKLLRETASKDLLEFLPDFIEASETRGRGERYLFQVESQCRKVFTECGWKSIRDVSLAT